MSNNELVIFSELTTDEKLTELEAQGAKYEGLYVDMGVAEERKYVKDQASFINGLLKKLDRARIDIKKSHAKAVEDEAASIRHRLEEANKPFTLLIDEWNAERKRILGEEKRVADMIAAQEQKDRDHEEAITLNRLWDLEAKDREAQREAEKQAQIKREADIAEQAAKKAIADAEQARKDEDARIERERKQREANKQYLANVNNQILDVLVSNGLSDEQAKLVVTLAAKGKLPHVKINY